MTALAARLRAPGVDVAAAVNLVAALSKYLALAFLFPIALALGYGEPPLPFVWAGLLAGGVAWGLELLTRGNEQVGSREGFLVVALTWLAAPAVGALPYLFADEPQLSNPLNAYFEAMSGFTTTGASVLTDIEGLDRSLAMWRQFTQWLGGMGIIVLALAVLPRLRVGGRQLFESEAPGPEVEPLARTIRDTARRLWALYLGLTGAMVVTLTAIGLSGLDERMSPFEAVAHAFTTLPTGGFSTHARSLAAFGAATQWTAIAFMLLAGANFALLFAVLVHRRGRLLARDEELRLYLALLSVGSLILLVELWSEGIQTGEAGLRHGILQAVSIMTTTGYASTDFNGWTALAAVTLVGLMFVGGSAGSTAGSVKVVRHLLIGRMLRRELDQTVHPELVSPIRLNGAPVEERTLRALIVFVLLYVGAFALGALLITIDSAFTDTDVRPFEAIAAAATTVGNVGPGFGFAGPMGSFEPFSAFSKVVMIVLMWIGRIEIIPVAVLLTRSYWVR